MHKDGSGKPVCAIGELDEVDQTDIARTQLLQAPELGQGQAAVALLLRGQQRRLPGASAMRLGRVHACVHNLRPAMQPRVDAR